MRFIFLTVLALIILPGSSQAQNSGLDIVKDPICFRIVNEAEYSVRGSISTAKFMHPRGEEASHRSNFRLEPKGSKHRDTLKPTDREEFCSYGPFLPNKSLRFTLRSLFPVHECISRVDIGRDIVIKGQRRADDSGVMTWTECFLANGSTTQKPEELSQKEALDRAF